jgi:hypothetical protein
LWNPDRMSLQKAIEVVTKLTHAGTVKQYAITGAVAALNYIQPTLTEDLDVLVSVGNFEQRTSGLILLAPIEAALARMGYSQRSDVGILVEGWPVQFLPVGSALDEEALARAVEIGIPGAAGDPSVRARVLRAEYLIANAVKLGRLKDLARVEAFLDQAAVDLPALRRVIERFDLLSAWKHFCVMAGRSDPL